MDTTKRSTQPVMDTTEAVNTLTDYLTQCTYRTSIRRKAAMELLRAARDGGLTKYDKEAITNALAVLEASEVDL